ncbi:mechanosensitive ion channel family protein [Actinopolymorpha pittospori]|uniref:Uncharacterized protein n=1 Tax=Actinopolymorpha pittospori TaxID=648752 RepID=A0A927RA73_9ACTN|nr:transporter [Actinopolymorpha pittospori]MBE1608657.1 hypothetical protein [Actinopolymorpha pittospori]
MNIVDSFWDAIGRIIGFLPNLISFLILLIVGYIVARVVAAVVRKVLEKVGVDRRLQESHARRYMERVFAGASAARGVARVVFWLIFAFFLFSAIGALKIPALTMFMNRVVDYLPNIIAAIFIFVLAALLAGAVAAGIGRVMGDTPTGRVAGTVLPALIMVVAVFMILQQLKIAEQIVQIAFAATMGALGLGLALAFGLGGRSVAQRMLEDAYNKSQEHRGQVTSDVETGRRRASEVTDEGVTGEGRTPPPGAGPGGDPGTRP